MQLVDTMQPGGAKVNFSCVFLDKWAPYFDSLMPLGLRCFVVCVMLCDDGGAHEGMHFSQSKNACLINHISSKESRLNPFTAEQMRHF